MADTILVSEAAKLLRLVSDERRAAGFDDDTAAGLDHMAGILDCVVTEKGADAEMILDTKSSNAIVQMVSYLDERMAYAAAEQRAGRMAPDM